MSSSRRGSARRFGAISPPTAIICDDDPGIRGFIRSLLEESGFEVVADAGMAIDAVDFAESLVPDVLILDLAMPGISGLDVIGEIREKTPTTTIVVYSAFADSPSAALERGASHVIVKTDVERLEVTLQLLAVQIAQRTTPRPDIER
jgi:DNA-binding NarL/FixJ family response regulator